MANLSDKKREYFWLGFSDLMTSLFFIMLVLFVLVYSSQNAVISDLNATKEELSVKISQYEKVQLLEAHMNKLRENPSFSYNEACQKFVVRDLIGKEIFEPNKSDIRPDLIPFAINAGRQIEQFLKDLNSDKRLSFILVIEGNMANRYDKRIDSNYYDGYRKSYDRALALYYLWHLNGIDLRKYNAEIFISGSGFNGLCREPVEDNNKRFSIQIMPKIGDTK